MSEHVSRTQAPPSRRQSSTNDRDDEHDAKSEAPYDSRGALAKRVSEADKGKHDKTATQADIDQERANAKKESVHAYRSEMVLVAKRIDRVSDGMKDQLKGKLSEQGDLHRIDEAQKIYDSNMLPAEVDHITLRAAAIGNDPILEEGLAELSSAYGRWVDAIVQVRNFAVGIEAHFKADHIPLHTSIKALYEKLGRQMEGAGALKPTSHRDNANETKHLTTAIKENLGAAQANVHLLTMAFMKEPFDKLRPVIGAAATHANAAAVFLKEAKKGTFAAQVKQLVNDTKKLVAALHVRGEVEIAVAQSNLASTVNVLPTLGK